MKLIAYDGKRFDDLGVVAGFPDDMQNGPPIFPVAITREGLPPLHVGMQRQSRLFTADFTVESNATATVETTITTLLGALRCGDSEARVMVAERNDGTQVESLMAAGQWRRVGVNTILVDFVAEDDLWHERVETVYPEVILEAPATLPLDNAGGAPVLPIFRLGWNLQRGTDSADVGWKYMTQETITNSGTKAWRRVRMTVDLGDTAALVTASKLQADGDDLRVRVHNTPSWMEIPRTLTNVNTKRTLCHFYATIPAGESVTYDFLYGNPSATAPTNLSTRTRNALSYAADDLEGTSGTANSATSTTLTVSPSPAWETNRWRYGYIQITAGTGAGQRRKIASNTADTITITRAWTTTPDTTSTFVIWMTGIAIDGGAASAAGTTTTLTDSSQAWSTNEWKGATLTNVTKSVTATVQSNTATVLTTSTMTAPALNDVYYLERYGVVQFFVNRGVTETAHRGLWRINKYFNKGSKVWYGDQVPGGWIPWLMLANQDDFAQGRYVDEGAAGGHAINNWPYLYARRAVRSDNTWPEEGQADGAMLYDPRGFVGIDFDYQMKNEGGIGQVVLMTQEPDGDDWQTAATDSTTRATLANVTASGIAGYTDLSSDAPNKIYLGVLPADGVEIPATAKKSRSVELRNHAKMLVYLDTTDMGARSNGIYVVGSESSVYDLRASYRISGGANAEPPYDVVETNVMLPSGRELWINPNLETGEPLFGIYNKTTNALVERAPLAARIWHHETNIDGTDTAIITKTLIPIPSGENLVPSPDTIDGWSLSGAGITATLSNETADTFDANNQAIKIAITAAPAGAWTLTMSRAAMDVVPGSLYEFGAVVKSDQIGLTVKAIATWQENAPGGATSAVDGTQTGSAFIALANTWYTVGSGRVIHGGDATNPPTGGVDLKITIEGSGNVTANVFLDLITLGSSGPVNVYVTEDEPGELTFEAAWTEAYYG